MTYQVWTDASHREKQDGVKVNVGSWAVIFLKEGTEFYRTSGIVVNTTIYAMELYAIYQGLFHCVHFLHDSKYFSFYSDARPIIDGINKWLPKWARNNWRGAKGKLSNQSLWIDLYNLNKKGSHTKVFTYNWIPGKSKVKWNDAAHDLALSTLKEYFDGQNKTRIGGSAT